MYPKMPKGQKQQRSRKLRRAVLSTSFTSIVTVISCSLSDSCPAGSTLSLPQPSAHLLSSLMARSLRMYRRQLGRMDRWWACRVRKKHSVGNFGSENRDGSLSEKHKQYKRKNLKINCFVYGETSNSIFFKMRKSRQR